MEVLAAAAGESSGDEEEEEEDFDWYIQQVAPEEEEAGGADLVLGQDTTRDRGYGFGFAQVEKDHGACSVDDFVLLCSYGTVYLHFFLCCHICKYFA